MEDEVNVRLNVVKEDLSIELDGEKYFLKDGRNGCKVCNLNKQKNKNWFKMGMRNVFLWNEDNDFGYKIFTEGKYQARRIYKLLWQKNWPMGDCHNIVSKEKVKLLHFMYNQLHKRGYGVKSFGLIKFNNSFWGLKMQRAVIDEQFNESITKGFLANNDRYRDDIRNTYKELGMNYLRIDLTPSNVAFCMKQRKILLFDIDFLHVRFGQTLDTAVKLGFKL